MGADGALNGMHLDSNLDNDVPSDDVEHALAKQLYPFDESRS
jgi:hypothetical protein